MLSPDKKVVQEARSSMAHFVPGVQNIYYGPVGESLGPGESRIWTLDGSISNVHLVLDWTMGWEGSWYEASYSVSYRLVGTEGWTTAKSTVHTDYYAASGSGTIDFSVPSGRYEIRIAVGIADRVTIREGRAELTEPSSWDYDSQVALTKFEYDSNHPRNLVARRVYNWTSNPGYPGVIPELQTTYEYDSDWHTYVTGISTDTVSTRASYDRLGRVRSYTTADGNTSSTTTYDYDKLGRLKQAVLPPQSPMGFTPTRTWFYVYPYGDDSRVEVRDEVAPGIYQWKQETYDSLGRFVAAFWGSGGTGLGPATWHQVTAVAYDEFGRVSVEKDALNNETTYGYDPFGRRISTRYPDPAEATEQTWYGVVGLPPDSTIPLTPPGDPTRFDWVRWEKSQDADENPVYRGYDSAGRLVWSAANPKDNLNPVVKPQPIVKTETTSTDFAQGTLSDVAATPTGDLVLGPARPEKVVAWGTDGYPYAASWISNAAMIVTNLSNRGWQTKNAVEIKSWMQGLINRGNAHGAVALFLGQAPDTVLELWIRTAPCGGS